jgi:type I restriction-modification system DNA methylase subunit
MNGDAGKRVMSQATLPGRYRNSNLFSGYYLDERVFGLDEWDCDEEAERVFEELRELYVAERDALASYDESPLREHWIDEVLSILGYEPLSETPILDARGSIDRTLYDSGSERRAGAVMKGDGEYAGMYDQSLSILEAKQWDADFTARFSETRSYRDASHQIKYYLEHTPESVSWGILTNGKKWRLYGTKDYETETYYEVDLPELLESGSVEVFKYFYVFFRPAAFRESGGTTFLDTVWSESETAAQELGEDLQDNVFTALRVLGEGFVATNDLTIDPANDERLAELKEHSLVLLYRLMFVLYAESRGLIDPDDPNSAREYEENFSLDALRREVIEEVGERAGTGDFEREFSQFSTSMWDQLENLFSLVDVGNESLGIPPYNGGLFDAESHGFLAENEVSDRHLAEVIYRLSTTETEDGFVPADYADLDTRHLGTIYEGLLEHEFAVAPEAQAAVSGDGGQVWKPADEVGNSEAIETVEAGELYVVNDDGERKATGAYYTPDYVVTYIVEETVGPLLSDIEDELAGMEPGTEAYVVAFWERVTDLKVLDPAMGSGHFLTKATGYLAEAVMEQVRELESGALFDEEWVRRKISRECIYGVDVNGMAVELAKLSMWLETLAADQPLAFLDHHLKAGNSLVGSEITEVLAAEDDEPGQVTLAYDFARTRRRALGQVMDNMSELLAIDNESLEQVKSMEDLYDDIREDPLYEHLQAMATVHTAGAFGLDVPEDAIERMARAIEEEDDWADIEATDWFRAARAMASEEGFFHWELEFPEVFFDGDGERLASAGFDAVVGNPPYVGTDRLPNATKQYLKSKYKSATGRWDLYVLFTEKGDRIMKSRLSYIQPLMFIRRAYGEGLREYLSTNSIIDEIVDLSEIQIFKGATNYTCIFTLTNDTTGKDEFDVYTPIDDNQPTLNKSQMDKYQLSNDELDSNPWRVIPPGVVKLTESIPDEFEKLGKISSTISEGVHTGCNDAFFITEEEARKEHLETDLIKPILKGKDIKRYSKPQTNLYCIYPYDKTGEVYSEDVLKSEYPNIWDRLKSYQERLKGRTYLINSEKNWYEIWCERHPDIYRNPKILTPDIAERNQFTIDYGSTNHYFNTKVKSIRIKNGTESDSLSLLGILNSSLIECIYRGISPPKRGGYRSYKPGFLSELKIPTQMPEELVDSVEELISSKNEIDELNLNLLDYLGTYEDGPTLGERYGPASGLAASVLTDTEADSEFEKLRVTAAQVERDGDRLRVLAVPYVKPTDEAAYETNSRGYATLEPVPAMEFVGLDDAQADLIAAFVPHAVAAAGGFAGYRDNATATISPLDRLEGLTLPALADVEGGIERYMDARKRAAELDEQIERTDALIDEIVYELYGLTDEEIEIVEEAVGG